MLLGLTLAVLGYGCAQIGILARLSHGLRSGIERVFAKPSCYDLGMATATVLIGIGVALDMYLLHRYIESGLRLAEISHSAVFGLFLIITGFQTFGFSLLVEMMRRVSR